ncbi:GNAT family N-acetyltransferase [Streptomyces tateyamensis]|uniref:GNAT family N-acetyltransferase n=1 Tax=Streptomyces tateyamensis TaxID=565073 RepID=A0A2V4NAK7_9ACTN|nr:GNAT family N-acetyltransferase [Streptomyces tateyamensis]PYC77055.1 GNAT family N-acetyltransferase [Streptomyces tateyamensis]
MTQLADPHDALSLRPLAAEEWEPWYDALETAFGSVESAERRAMWHALTEVDRSLGVWEGEAPVGTAGAFSFRMAVPGGAVLPTAGVTMVGVLPTHRRRGVLTALMRHQLDDVHERGEALAVLTASEPAIYGRYGYGLGTWKLRVEAPRAWVRVAPGPEDGRIRLRLADPRAALAHCERLYHELVPRRPGMLARRPGWERLPVFDPPAERGGHGPLHCLLAEDRTDGELLGYARYSVAEQWLDGGPAGVVRVREVTAASAAARRALWRYLLDLDLTETVQVPSLPLDDPLLHLVGDPRRLRPRQLDALFVRLVEVGDALRSRRYAAPVDVVLAVQDEFCPWNTGHWHLHSAGPEKGAACEPTEASAELALAVRELGAAYLGGTTLAALAGAGLVTELRPGALAEASRAFAWDVAPWLPHGF